MRPPATPDAGSAQAAYLFTDLTNAAGGFDTTVSEPDVTMTLSGHAVTDVKPNNTQFQPPPASPIADGFVLVGAPAAAKDQERGVRA